MNTLISSCHFPNARILLLERLQNKPAQSQQSEYKNYLNLT